MDNERTNRSAAVLISRTLENALQYVRGTGQWFSARDKDAVMSQLIEAQKELDKLNAVVEAARGLIDEEQQIWIRENEYNQSAKYCAFCMSSDGHDSECEFEALHRAVTALAAVGEGE
jgi:hypothetical protein